MRVVARTIQHQSRTDVIRLYPLGDVHVGNAACQEKLFLDKVAEIKQDPLAYWIGMGDYCEFIAPSDPRWDPTNAPKWLTVPDLADLPKAQRDRFLELVDPIAPKCLALIRGNHEYTIHRKYERAIFDEIVANIKARMDSPPHSLGLGVSGFIRLRLERGRKKTKGHYWTIDIFAHHGWGGGALAGSKALKLERAMHWYRAHLILIGHWHTHQTDRNSEIGLNRSGTLIRHLTRGAVTGAWFESHIEDAGTYAEEKGYPPSTIGCPTIELHPATEQIRIIT